MLHPIKREYECCIYQRTQSDHLQIDCLIETSDIHSLLFHLAEPKTKKQLRSFIGVINYYRDMWKGRSDLLAPLSAMTSKKAPWNWTPQCQKAFDEIKKVVSRETLLAYPDFNKIFEIHTDASKSQLGAVISQEGKPIAFYSRKLSSAQVNYTTTEQEPTHTFFF